MATRRTLDRPFAPRDPNMVGAKYERPKTQRKPLDHRRQMSSPPEQPRDNDYFGKMDEAQEVQLNEDDTTDSFMKQMIREENKGHLRAQSEDVGKLQAFRKARTRPRTTLTMENLKRHTDIATPAPPEVRSKSSLGSVSSAHSDPPLNVPTEWGRKAKKNPQWIRRIRTDHPGLYPDSGANGADAAAGGADMVIPSIEVEDSPLSRRGSNRGTPASRRISKSPTKSEDDLQFSDSFNEADILASTPAPHRRTDPLDEIRQREAEVALEDSTIYPTPPREKSRSRSRPRTPPTVQKVQPSLSTKTEQTAGQVSKEAPSSSEEGKRVNGTAGKPEVTNNSRNDGDEAPRKPANEPEATPRPQAHREDSRDILRRLSRHSATPSPVQSKPRDSKIPVRMQSPEAVKAKAVSQPTARRESSKDRSKQSTRQDSVTRKSHDDAPADRAGVTKDPEEAPPESPQQTTTAEVANGNPPKTPVVTGAWVDTTLGPNTPRPSILDDAVRISSRKSPSKRDEAAEARSEALKARPQLPSSALHAILHQARGKGLQQEEGKPDDALGEATINSLQDLVGPSSDSSPVNPEDDTIEQLELPTEKPKTAAEKQRLEELMRIKKMNQRIIKLQGDMHSMHKGVNNISKMTEKTETTGSGSATATTSEAPVAVMVTEKNCETCQDPWKMFSTGLKQTFWVYRQDQSSWKGFRLGPGFWVLLIPMAIAYALSELIACMIFCRPVLASSMEGYGLYPDAPKLPFVIPTMAVRPFKFIWGPAIEYLEPFVVWLYHFLIYLFEEGMGSSPPAATSGVAASVVAGAPGDFGMGQDAYI